MRIEAYGVSDVGKKREKNEDNFLVEPDRGLFLVADGMGGHQGGGYASRLAVDTIRDVIHQVQEDPESTLLTPGITDRNNAGEQLRYAIRVASKRVFDESIQDLSLRGMGTTVVGLHFQRDTGDAAKLGNKLYLAHVGDSRAYLIQSGVIQQLTIDHSLVTEQLKAGMISPGEVRHHKLKNIITRSVGFQSDVQCDLASFEVKPGDSYLLCTDGLTNMLEDKEILRIAAKNQPQFTCEKLVELANRRGGDDNVTVVVITCQE